MVHEVGAFYRVLPDEVTRRPLSWLVAVHEQVARREFEAQVSAIRTVEIGTLRALARTLGKKGEKLPDLPTWEDQQAAALGENVEPWMIAFELANSKKEQNNDAN